VDEGDTVSRGIVALEGGLVRLRQANAQTIVTEVLPGASP
jgi:hypothetical protein